MPFNGSGTFNPQITFVPNTLATAEDQNVQDLDFAQGLSDCMTRDGQAPATANISMGGKQINDLSPGVAATDAVNFSQLSTYLPPSGLIQMYGGNAPPAGYLFCDGTAYSRSTYSGLYNIIGNTYGNGDGVSTFNVPDLRSRVALGSGTGTGLSTRIIGSSGGEETHTLSITEIPSHTHTDSGHTHTDAGHAHTPGGAQYFLETSNAAGTGFAGASGLTYTISGGTGTAQAAIQTASANIQSTGGGGAHNNMQPWLAVNYIIKT